MIKQTTINEALLANVLLNLREGNVRSCLNLGFSEDELKAINQLTLDELFYISHSTVQFAKVEINHDAFWKLLAVAQENAEEQQVIDRALLLCASIEMLNQYFGLSTSAVSARRQLLGKEEKMGRKVAATDEEQELIWHLWKKYQSTIENLNSLEGLELLSLIAEESNMNLTVVWKIVCEWKHN